MATSHKLPEIPDSHAAALIERYQDPMPYFKEVLGVRRLWDDKAEYGDQGKVLREIPRALKEHKPLVITSGHALGKDFLSGGIPLWWQNSRYPAKAIITGPTDRQVKEIVWNELERPYRRAKLPIGGKLLTGKLEWSDEHFILGFTTQNVSAETTQGIGKAQGFHSPNILVIVTEAQAVQERTWEQLDGLLTSQNSLLIAIGNPLISTGRFAKMIRDPEHNIVITLDCENSPNVRTGQELIPGMVSRQWVEDKRRLWFSSDPNHPLWLAKVKGQLPISSVNTLFSDEMLKDAVGRRLTELVHKVVVSIDVARFGDDESVLYALESGKGAIAMEHTSKQPTTDTAGRGLIMQKAHKANLILVDADGVGGGVVDMLREMGADVSGIHGSAEAEDKENFHNLRAQIWSYAAEQVRTGHMNLPDDPQLLEELRAVTFFFDSKGRTQITEKDDIKETLGRSPDRADAFVLGVWALKKADPIKKRDAYRIYAESESYGSEVHGYMVA